MEKEKSSKAFIGILALLICSIAVNVLLARKIDNLRYTITSLKEEGNLQPGETVPTLSAKGLDGTDISFTYENSQLPSIIYVLGPGCSWCEKNQKNAEVLANKVVNKYRFIAISLNSNGLKEYVNSHQIPFAVYTDLPQDIKSKYKFGGTPQTVVVSSEGRVLKNWRGAYTDDLKTEIESFFSISLPGITINK